MGCSGEEVARQTQQWGHGPQVPTGKRIVVELGVGRIVLYLFASREQTPDIAQGWPHTDQ